MTGATPRTGPFAPLLGLAPTGAAHGIAYVDVDGNLVYVDISTGARRKLASGCGPLENPRLQAVLWSADGSHVFCETGLDGVVGSDSAGDAHMVFGIGQCRVDARPAPDGRVVACATNGGVELRDAAGHLVARVDGAIGGLSWDSTGRFLVYGRPSSYSAGIVDRDGAHVLSIDDAYASPGPGGAFAWTRDGARLAYPSEEGLKVCNFVAGASCSALHTVGLDGFAWGSVSGLEWMHGGAWLLLASTVDSTLHFVDAATGRPARDPLPGVTSWAIAPDAEHVAVLQYDVDPASPHVVVLDLGTGALHQLGAQFDLHGEGDPPSFVFSGDSARVCWRPNAGQGQPDPVECSAADGGAVTRVARSAVRRPEIEGPAGPGRWFALAPDLERVAYTEIAAGGSGTLWISDLDGGHAVEIGPILSPTSFAWQPDGSWRRPS